MKHLLKSLSLTIFACLANSVYADDHFQFSGFGTLGVVVSDSDTHGYRRDVRVDSGVFSGDIDFKNNSLLGLQLDADLSERIDFVSQVVLRDLPESSFDHYLTMAFLRFNASPNWSFRVGRTAPDLFLMTEYRDVDFSYPWATPPNEIYGIVPNRHIDGADITYSTKLNGGTLSAKLFGGVSETDVSAWYTSEHIEMEDAYGISLTYDNFNWSIQAKHTQVKIANDIKSNQLLAQQFSLLPEFVWPNSSQFASNLVLKGEKLTYTSINGQYNTGPWLLSAELSRINSGSIIIPKIGSAYLGAAYQIDNHQLFSLAAFTNADNYTFNEPNVVTEAIPELIGAIDLAFNFYTTNQETISIGWRWDISSSISSTIQWNHTNVDAKGGTLWWTPNSDLNEESINTVMFNVSFVF